MNPAPADEELGRRVVLVVEDEILVRSAIAEYLRDEGYTVIEAANAAEAQTVFTSLAAVDIVFTDLQMPGDMDGAMLAAWIGRHHPSVPVLLTSGFANIAAGSIPTRGFVRKPYSPDSVAALIGNLIETQG